MYMNPVITNCKMLGKIKKRKQYSIIYCKQKDRYVSREKIFEII